MKKEDKFIVFNWKRLKELTDAGLEGQSVASQFLAAIDDFNEGYKAVMGKTINQRYIVVNEDEPYADKVWQLILKAEISEDSIKKYLLEDIEYLSNRNIGKLYKYVRKHLIANIDGLVDPLENY